MAIAKPQKMSFQEYLDSVGDDRVEYINGETYLMAAASARHSLLQASFCTNVASLATSNPTFDGPNGLWFLTEAWTKYGETALIHDVAAFRKKDLPEIPESGPIGAQPFWVCEILSPSNWSHDTEHKRIILQRNKVPYYWIVNPTDPSILVFTLERELYGIQRFVHSSEGVSDLEPFGELDLKQVFSFSG